MWSLWMPRRVLMSGLRFSLLSFALGCGQRGPPLTRLVDAWTEETINRARPTMTDTLVLAALAAEMCVERQNPAWTELAFGQPLPTSDALGGVFGSGTVQQVDQAENIVMVVVDGVALESQDPVWMRIGFSNTEGLFQVEFSALVGGGDDGTERGNGEAFGTVTVTVNGACSVAESIVNGSALWVDSGGRRAELMLPDDSALGNQLRLRLGDTPRFPTNGAIAWTTGVGEGERKLTTQDATEIFEDDEGLVQWPVTVRGPGWTGEGLSELGP